MSTTLRPEDRIETDAREIKNVLRDLNAALKRLGVECGEYDFNENPRLYDVDEFPSTFGGQRWIACFPVTGGSEGYYVHVELIYTVNNKRQLIGVAKTWTWESACRIANTVAWLLQA